MFKKIFIDLCNERKESPTAVCKALGLSAATFSCWTDDSVPRRATLQRMADYFDVSVDYLLGKEEKDFSLGRIFEREDDELWKKIATLDPTDRIKAEAFVDGLLAADKYQEPTHQIKIAARGGGVKEITVTDSQLQAIKNLPEVTSLDDLGN